MKTSFRQLAAAAITVIAASSNSMALDDFSVTNGYNADLTSNKTEEQLRNLAFQSQIEALSPEQMKETEYLLRS